MNFLYKVYVRILEAYEYGMELTAAGALTEAARAEAIRSRVNNILR